MLFWAGALAVFALDQITKYLVHLRLTPNQSWWLFTYVQNRGAAFGLFQGKRFFFVVAGALVIALIFYFHSKFKSSDLLQLPLGLMLGGSAGNLIDRLARRYVVDFIDFRFWPVFNVADTGLNIGVGLLILIFLLKKEG
ncbi:signal peptidase II [Candidatus Saganbacteria bacterium]|nr:signal peptidase II [Candidatus Saganbacteria bacterium]